MKVIVAGGRHFENYTLLKFKLNEILKNVQEEIIIVSGGAPGADALGEQYAKEKGYRVEKYKALWDDTDAPGAVLKERVLPDGRGYGYYNIMAGHQRNEQMALIADALVAFHDGASTGTKDMIQRATNHNLKIRIIKYA